MAQKERKYPQRMCVSCREMRDKRDLLRVVRTPENQVNIDTTGKASGRGAYICNSASCFNKARKSKALERALNVSVNDEFYTLLENMLKKDE